MIVVKDSNLDRERVASSEADTTASTAQHSSPRPSKPPSAFVSNPYGSDMPATDPGQDSMPADADQENDEELLAEEFSSLCDDEEVDDVSTLPDKPKGPPRSTMPTWLMSEYHRLREQLNEEMSKNSSRAPSCYDRNSFYEGIENLFLAARRTSDRPSKKSRTARSCTYCRSIECNGRWGISKCAVKKHHLSLTHQTSASAASGSAAART
ncbi:hypothetical protein BS17DRAFT_120562 [Gyrodon lividus]|nr:hypothetical protein BS17DRAFT_120562 [Gyrodon lividus]